MKIAVFDDLPEGGAKRVTFEQIKRLSQNHEIEYITNKVLSRFPFEQYAHDIVRFDFEPSHHHGFMRPLSELSIVTRVMPRFRQAANYINSLNVDVVLVRPSRFSQAPPILSMLNSPSLYMADEWLRLVYEPELHPLPVGIKGVYERLRRGWIKSIDHHAVKSATRVVVTSSYMHQAFINAYGIQPRLCRLGVDSDYFCTGDVDEVEDRFLFVGEPEKINGYELVALLPVAMRKKVQVIRFKSGQFRYTESQIRSFYRRSIATICLSVQEPFGLATLESMACGTPVIAVNEGGYMDTVLHHKTGILIHRNPDELNQAMKRLIENKVLRLKLGVAARVRAVKHFSWKNHILELERNMTEISR